MGCCQCFKSLPHVEGVTVLSKDPKLDVCNKENTVVFIPPLGDQTPPYSVWARVLDIYDGDTITVACYGPCESGPFSWKVRLIGIDAPEIRSRDILEKEHGIRCRNYLRYLLGSNLVLIGVSPEKDKYGRILGTVNVYETSTKSFFNVGQRMIQHTPVKPYDGKGPKINWGNYLRTASRDEIGNEKYWSLV